MKKLLATWGFVIAGAMFLFASLVPLLEREGINTTFSVLAIVFLILGAGVVKRSRPGQANAD